MAIISYFPSADNLKKISKLGDVITVKSLKATSTQVLSSYYSNNNLLSVNSFAFSSMKNQITAVYLPECITIGSSAFASTALTYASFPKCTFISREAFLNCNYLETVNAPNCASISASAFYECSVMSKIHFPACSIVGNGAFKCYWSYSHYPARTINLPNCTIIESSAFLNNNINNLYIPKIEIINTSAFAEACITVSGYDMYLSSCISILSSAFYSTKFIADSILNFTLHFPNCTTIGSYAFAGCNLMNFSFNECTSLGNSAFDNAYNLAEVSFNKLTSIPSYAFRNTQLNYGNFPACTSIAVGAFNNCSVMYDVSFPLCTTITGINTSTSTTFYNCKALTTVSFPKLSLLSTGYIFAGCTSLMRIYLMNSIVCTLNTSSAFRYTPITDSTYTGTFGSIYVPSSLLASYKAATNWKTISARIVGI